jgi:hypothetical protein
MREPEERTADYDGSYSPDRCVAYEFAHPSYHITAKYHFFAEGGERQRFSEPRQEGARVTGCTENREIYRVPSHENGKRYNRNPDGEKETHGRGDCITESFATERQADASPRLTTQARESKATVGRAGEVVRG